VVGVQSGQFNLPAVEIAHRGLSFFLDRLATLLLESGPSRMAGCDLKFDRPDRRDR
jgi:hypothetical protein